MRSVKLRSLVRSWSKGWPMDVFVAVVARASISPSSMFNSLALTTSRNRPCRNFGSLSRSQTRRSHRLNLDPHTVPETAWPVGSLRRLHLLRMGNPQTLSPCTGRYGRLYEQARWHPTQATDAQPSWPPSARLTKHRLNVDPLRPFSHVKTADFHPSSDS